jgi:hypothetical protein
LSLGAKLRYKSNIVEMANAAAVNMRAEYEAAKAEVAEAAPTPKPQAPSTKSSTPVESTSTGQPSAPSEQEAAPPLAPASPTPPPSASEDEELEVVDLPIGAPDLEADVRPMILSVVEKCGKPVMEELLSRFGVVKASHIEPALLPELVALMQEALAK